MLNDDRVSQLGHSVSVERHVKVDIFEAKIHS